MAFLRLFSLRKLEIIMKASTSTFPATGTTNFWCSASGPSCVDKKTVVKIQLLVVAILGVGGCIVLGVWGEALLSELYQTTSQMIALTAVLGGVGGGSGLAILIWTIMDCMRANRAASSFTSVNAEGAKTVSVQKKSAPPLKWRVIPTYNDHFKEECFFVSIVEDKVLIGYGEGMPAELQKLNNTVGKLPLSPGSMKILNRKDLAMVGRVHADGRLFTHCRLREVSREGHVLTLEMLDTHSSAGVTFLSKGFTTEKVDTIHIQHEDTTVVTLSCHPDQESI
jgi:hypothetical protein